MKKPDDLWLQTENALSEYEFTHCDTKINDDDTHYLRASTLSDRPAEELAKLGLKKIPDNKCTCGRCTEAAIDAYYDEEQR